MRAPGYYLTDDFQAESYGHTVTVRDINFRPDNTRLPDEAICRVFSNRIDAEKILKSFEPHTTCAVVGFDIKDSHIHTIGGPTK